MAKGRRNVLIKISGDLINHSKVIDFIRKQSQKAFVVVLVGGGTDISRVLRKKRYYSHFIDGVGRFITSFSGRQLARDILERNQKVLQDRLAELGIHAVVVIPVVDLGSVLCHFNGDNLVSAASLNFDRTHVLTLKGREKQLKGHNLKIVAI